MTNDKTYNGWTNYETWQCYLHLFDGWSKQDLMDYAGDDDLNNCVSAVKAFVEEYIDHATENPGNLISDILFAWCRAVDYQEIAENLLASE